MVCWHWLFVFWELTDCCWLVMVVTIESSFGWDFWLVLLVVCRRSTKMFWHSDCCLISTFWCVLIEVPWHRLILIPCVCRWIDWSIVIVIFACVCLWISCRLAWWFMCWVRGACILEWSKCLLIDGDGVICFSNCIYYLPSHDVMQFRLIYETTIK